MTFVQKQKCADPNHKIKHIQPFFFIKNKFTPTVPQLRTEIQPHFKLQHNIHTGLKGRGNKGRKGYYPSKQYHKYITESKFIISFTFYEKKSLCTAQYYLLVKEYL